MLRNHIMDPESSQNRQYGNNNNSGNDDAWFSAANDSPQQQQYAPQQHYGRGQGQGQQYNQYQPQQQNYNPAPSSPNSMSYSMQQRQQHQQSPMSMNNMNMNMNMNNSMAGGNGGSVGVDDYENEPPLLEELGINFDHIWSKTQAVVNPNAPLDEHILDDADLAGPIFFCLLLGACLLLSGKIHFGYIYGFSVFGCLGMHSMLNLMVPGTGLDFYRTCSVLGYCLLPVVALACVSIILSLRGFFGLLLSSAVIGWCTYTATRMFDAKLRLSEQFWLVAYPAMLFYSCFVLITIF